MGVLKYPFNLLQFEVRFNPNKLKVKRMGQKISAFKISIPLQQIKLSLQKWIRAITVITMVFLHTICDSILEGKSVCYADAQFQW